MISVDFPVKPHIKKFLETRYGKSYITSNRDVLNSILVIVMSKKFNISSKNVGYDYTFKVNLTEAFLNIYGVFINQSRISYFNSRVEGIFKDELFGLMLINKKVHGFSHKKTMRGYLDHYNITEDDVNFDTLYRTFLRYRDGKEVKI